jgi:hypothetical protein
MARMALTFGACPVCDRHVPRTLQMAAGLRKEIFHCPEHGRLAYEPHNVPLAELGATSVSIPLTADFAQPLTGLELVH